MIMAFTLVEMLVVIAIIAILAALLVPVLSIGKLRAQRVACVNNVKELTDAFLLYMNETGSLVTTHNKNNEDWMGTLYPYYSQSAKLRFCPLAPLKNKMVSETMIGTADSAWGWGHSAIPVYGSYAFNGWLYTDPNVNNTRNFPNYLFNKENKIRKPAETPAFIDSVWLNLWPLETDVMPNNLYAPGDSQEGIIRICIARHGSRPPSAAPTDFNPMPGTRTPGAVNIGLADGHVETSRLDGLWNYSWHYAWQVAMQPQ